MAYAAEDARDGQFLSNGKPPRTDEPCRANPVTALTHVAERQQKRACRYYPHFENVRYDSDSGGKIPFNLNLASGSYGDARGGPSMSLIGICMLMSSLVFRLENSPEPIQNWEKCLVMGRIIK